MSDRLPLPADLLDRRARPPIVDPHSNGVAHKLLALADRGDYLEAAEQAADLLRGTDDDVRLIAVYLVGLFVERGPTSLPDVLASVERLLDQPPTQAIESAMQWLFRAIADRVAFHTQQRDETWNTWLQEVTPAHIEEITGRSERIVAKSPGGTTMLRKLARWTTTKLGPAAARTVKVVPAAVESEAEAPALDDDGEREPSWDEPDPEPQELNFAHAEAELEEPEFDEPDQPDDEESAWDEPETYEHVEPRGRDHSPMSFGEPSPGADAPFDSPALAKLCDKLRGFETVLARGELDKAAIIARDVQAIILSFDPITYLPSLFANHFKLVRRCVHELEPHWADDSAAGQVLDQLYRADLDGFIND